MRFVLFTGEEQGLYGSAAYANAVAAAGDNIVAVYNMDMIAWDNVGAPTLRLHTRTTSNPGYAGDLAIAGVFTNVVSAYGLSGSLVPIIDPDGESASDHASFWNKGYPAILAIEDDDDDFNAYYHTINDNLAHINLTYFTNFVKASIGTAAHLAQPSDFAALQGIVVDASNSNPIGLAQVFATAGVTRTGIDHRHNCRILHAATVGGQLHRHRLGVWLLAADRRPHRAANQHHHHAEFCAGPRAHIYRHRSSTGRAHTASAHRHDHDHRLSRQPHHHRCDRRLSHRSGRRSRLHLPCAGQSPGLFRARSSRRAADDRSGGRLRPAADLSACLAPDYTFTGIREQFDATSLPADWAVINNVGTAGWSLRQSQSRANLTGGTGNFAIADSDNAGAGVSMDTELRSPTMDFTTADRVTLTLQDRLPLSGSQPSRKWPMSMSASMAQPGRGPTVWRKTADYRGPQDRDP